jgi:hypothetical protein
MKDISIGIGTSYKLNNINENCRQTWAKDFDNVYFFGGDIFVSNLIRLEGVGEDYNSYFPKQMLGLKYMFEDDPNVKWYSFIGADHVYFKDRLIRKLNEFDYTKDYIIGELYDIVTTVPRKINIEGTTITLIAGGGGLFISNSLMKKMYERIEEFMIYWKYLYDTRIYGGYPHGDVALCLMAKKYFNVDTTHLEGLHSQHPTFYPDYPNIKDPLTFHYIKGDMDKIYNQYK